MAAAQGLVTATEALVGLCSERVRELESLAVIIGQGKEDELTVFAQQLAAVESALGDVVDRVQRDLACAKRAKDTARALQAVAARMAALDAFLSKMAPTPQQQQPQQQQADSQDAAPAGSPKRSSRPVAATQVRVPTAAALETVPRYMRSKLSHADVVTLCSALNSPSTQQPFGADDVQARTLDSAQIKSGLQCLLRLGHIRVVTPGSYEFCE